MHELNFVFSAINLPHVHFSIRPAMGTCVGKHKEVSPSPTLSTCKEPPNAPLEASLVTGISSTGTGACPPILNAHLSILVPHPSLRLALLSDGGLAWPPWLAVGPMIGLENSAGCSRSMRTGSLSQVYPSNNSGGMAVTTLTSNSDHVHSNEKGSLTSHFP